MVAARMTAMLAHARRGCLAATFVPLLADVLAMR
jgi:hypothetical protein